ncbi:MAG: AI-2E family transporter [Patescibacteria group bacterium]
MIDNKVHIDISWATLLRVFTFFLMIAGLYLAREVVGVLLIGIVISLGLDPVVGWMEEKKIPRLLGTIFAFLTGIIVLATVIYVVIPVVAAEAGGFVQFINNTLASISDIHLPKEWVQSINVSVGDAFGVLSAIPVASVLGTIFSSTVMVIATILVSFYLTVDHNGTERLLRVMLPGVYESSVLHVFTRFKIKIRRWFAAQLLLSVIMALIVGFLMWILGVKYALVIGLLAGVFELVPMIGPIVTGAVAFGVAISDSAGLALWAILSFVILQQLENHILVPVVMGKAVRVHPVIVVISILMGGSIGGFIGIVLAVPVAVLAQEVFEFVSEKKNSRPEPLGV